MADAQAPCAHGGDDRRDHPVDGLHSRCCLGRQAGGAGGRKFDAIRPSRNCPIRPVMRARWRKCSGMRALIPSTSQVDVGNLEFKRAIRRFEATADEADIAVVYYAGHGLEIGGDQLPDPDRCAARQRPRCRRRGDRAGAAGIVGRRRQAAAADHSRRLPRQPVCRHHAARTQGRQSRGVAAVSARFEPTSTDTLIAYAAKAGSTADDGDGQHSPFTTAVLKNLTVPGLDVRLAFGRVRDDVLKNDRQPAGAVRLRFARRQQRGAGAAAGGPAGSAGKRRQGRLRSGPADRNASRLGGLSRPTSDRLLCRSGHARRSRR